VPRFLDPIPFSFFAVSDQGDKMLAIGDIENKTFTEQGLRPLFRLFCFVCRDKR
jgi:hypothetical protein